MQTNSMTKELREKAFKAKEDNIKQTSGIQIIFLLEIKLQKYSF